MRTSFDFEKITKKKKYQNWVKLIGLSSFITLSLGFGVIMGGRELTARNGRQVMENFMISNTIAYPNIAHTSWTYEPSSQFSGVFRARRVKDIDGIMVPFESYEGNYAWNLNYSLNQGERLKSGDDGRSSYTYATLYKVPNFYASNVEDYEYFIKTQDIDFIPAMVGKAVEVAVSFDKPYTLAEIQQMIPDNLKLNWIWVGSDSNLFYGSPATQFGFEADESLFSADVEDKLVQEIEEALKKDPETDITTIHDKYKQKLSALEGLQNSYTFFQSRVQKFLDAGRGFSVIQGKDGKEYSTDGFLKKYLKENRDPKTAKFSGVILTGRAENFEQLKGANWIYASNIGQSVEIQPYHSLTK